MKQIILLAAFVFATAQPVAAADRILVVNEGGIADAWTLPEGTTLAVPRYPEAHAADAAEACVAIGYLLNADGSTSDYALVEAWSAARPTRDREAYWASFAEAAAGALAQWRFQPRPGVAKPRPVYTVATFVFGASAPAETRKHCGIPNLGVRLVELRNDAPARRRVSRDNILGRLDLEPFLEERYLQQQKLRGEIRRAALPPVPVRPPPPPPPPPPQP